MADDGNDPDTAYRMGSAEYKAWVDSRGHAYSERYLRYEEYLLEQEYRANPKYRFMIDRCVQAMTQLVKKQKEKKK